MPFTLSIHLHLPALIPPDEPGRGGALHAVLTETCSAQCGRTDEGQTGGQAGGRTDGRTQGG